MFDSASIQAQPPGLGVGGTHATNAREQKEKDLDNLIRLVLRSANPL